MPETNFDDMTPEEQKVEEARLVAEIDAKAARGDDKGDNPDKDADEDKEDDKDEAGKKDKADSDKGGDEEEDDKDGSDDDKEIDYSDLKLPDDSMLAPSDLETLTSFAKDSELSVEAAQGVLDKVEEIVEGIGKRQSDELDKAHKAWDKEVKNDSELGGKNSKEAGELSFRVMERFGSKEFDEVLKASGLGRHPEFRRFVHQIAKASQDDKFVAGHENADKKPTKSWADRMYPGTANK